MSYPVYGNVPSGDVLPILFDTFAGATGASITASGLAVTDIEVYKDGGTTQRASDAGYTLLDTDGLDFDGLTGIHGFSIDTGDNTDAGFYTVGAWFHVVVSAITVDSQTVSFIAAAFRLVPAESVAGKPKVDTDTFGGTAGTFASGRPEVNTTHVGGTAQTANDIGAGVTDIRARLPAALVGGRIDANMGAISGDATAADNLEEGATGLVPGTCAAGSTTTSIVTNLTEATNDHYNGRIITFTGGALLGQSTDITGYVGATKTLTVTALTEAPANTDPFVIS